MSDVQPLLNARNTEAVQATLRRVEAQVYAQDEKVAALHAALASAMERVAALELRIAVMKAASMGHGPTVP